MKHPYFNKGAIKRLYADYLKYGSLYIAFDFDNTVWDYDTWGNKYEYHEGTCHGQMVYLLQQAQMLGMKLILWTSCPTIEDQHKKVIICQRLGIMPDYVNCSPLSPGAVKPHFNLLLDDRAGLESAVEILNEVITLIIADQYD